MDLDQAARTELEAAVFRRLVAHLKSRTDVQNIDLMTLAGFCRNCLGNWYSEAAGARGIPMSRDEGREEVYGMPYAVWKELNQGPTLHVHSHEGGEAATSLPDIGLDHKP